MKTDMETDIKTEMKNELDEKLRAICKLKRNKPKGDFIKIEDLKKIQRALGMGNKQLGEELGTTEQCIVNWRTGLTGIPVSNCIKLLKFTIRQLMAREGVDVFADYMEVRPPRGKR